MRFPIQVHLILLSAVLGLSSAAAQSSLYMPIEFRRAYERGTRSWDGEVSEKYRQNTATYDLTASVNPKTRQVNCSGKIRYTNRQEKALPYIVFHTYKEIHFGGFKIKSAEIDGITRDFGDRKKNQFGGSFYRMILDNPLASGASLDLTMEWSFFIPKEVDRDGAYDKTSMLVAYWYPEIAVYDDVFGWDEILFDGKAEFYHDVSSFKVSIELPKNYVVWASAEPLNSQEIYPAPILERIALAKKSDEKVTIIGAEDLKRGLKMNANVWKYAVDSFPDFSFAFSDHYQWEACRYQDKFGTYFLNSAYPAQNAPFADVLKIETEALFSFHNDFPRYPFPFKHFVAFNGETGGGMEFAGMCNDQVRTNYVTEGVAYSDYDANKLLTFHEMMHMYFPFLMGINEKRFAWMDEGMAEFSEDFFTNVNLESTRDRSRFARSSNAPLMVETYSIPKTYGINSYDIASQSYHALLYLLGKPLFDKCLKGYMDRWKYKHPAPYDYMFTFNDLSGKNLDWFWKAWYFDWGYPDVGVKSFDDGVLIIENIGGRPIAVDVEVRYKNGDLQTFAINPSVWQQASNYRMTIENAKEVGQMELKTMNGSDAIQENNLWVSK